MKASEDAAAPSPSLRFHYSSELHARVLALLDQVERAEDAAAHRDEVAELVVQLTEAGLDDYFMKPLDRTRPGFVIRQSANVGMAGARQVMGSVLRRIIGHMDGPQILSVCASIRDLMR